MAKSGNHIGEEKILYVEGPNDKWVTISLRQQYQHKEDVNIIDLENCDLALQALSTKASSPSDTKRIGLIIDADTNITARYQSIIKELKSTLGITITSAELANVNGFVRDITNLAGDTVRIGIWIMPDNISAGRLEDFLFNKIERTNGIFQQVEPALSAIENIAGKDASIAAKIYKPIHRDKAKLHTFMAWNNPPDMSMGMAVRKGFFPIESAEEKLFRRWMEELFYA